MPHAEDFLKSPFVIFTRLGTESGECSRIQSVDRLRHSCWRETSWGAVCWNILNVCRRSRVVNSRLFGTSKIQLTAASVASNLYGQSLEWAWLVITTSNNHERLQAPMIGAVLYIMLIRSMKTHVSRGARGLKSKLERRRRKRNVQMTSFITSRWHLT